MYVCAMDETVVNELRSRKRGRKPSINYLRNHYVFLTLYDYDVKKKIEEVYNVDSYLFEVLLMCFLCSSVTDQPYFTTTMVHRLLPRKHNTNVNRNLKRLVELGYLDKVRSKGWGAASRYSCNGSTLKLLRFYSFTMNRLIKERDLSYVIE